MSRELASELVTHLEEVVGEHESALREIENSRERSNRMHQQLMDRFEGKPIEEQFIPTFEQPEDIYAPAKRRIEMNRLLMQLYAFSSIRPRLDQIFALLNPPPVELSPPPMPQLPDLGTQNSVKGFFSEMNSSMLAYSTAWDDLVKQENDRENEALRLAREVLQELSQ